MPAMSKPTIIKQYLLIINKISKHRYCNYREIQDHLRKFDFQPSLRTFQRYLEAIRTEFDIDICYDTAERGYFIGDDGTNFQTYMKYLDLSITCDFIVETLQEGKKALDFVIFESTDQLRNIESLKDLFMATKACKIIQFDYFNYQSKKMSTIKLEPHLLKEYSNRWYVIGILHGTELERTFALDRMSALQIGSETFFRKPLDGARQAFDQIVGVNYAGGKAKRVLLRLDRQQAQYLESLPIHHSQRTVARAETSVTIELYLIPNYELETVILGMGEGVEVIEPQELRINIKERSWAAAQKYLA
jgi:WYL domain